MPLEIVPGSEVQTQVGAAKINAQDFRAAALAKGSVIAGAGEDVAKLFNDVSTKLQDIRNTKHVVDADNAINQFNQQAQENVLKEPKPEGWSQSYNAQFKAFQDQYMAEHPEFGPEVRNHVQNMLERSKVATDINIRTAANKRLLSDTNESIEYGMGTAVNSLPREAATAKYMNGLMLLKEKGILDDTQYNIRVQQAPKVIGKGQFDQAVQRDPVEAWKKLQAKDGNGNATWLPEFTGQDRIGLENEGRAKFYEKQRINENELNVQFAKTNMTDQQKIDFVTKQAEDLMVTQQYADLKIRAIKRADSKLQAESYNAIEQLAKRNIVYGNPNIEEDTKNLSGLIGGIEDNAKALKLQNLITDLQKKSKQPEVAAEKKNIEENKRDIIGAVRKQVQQYGPILPQVVTEKESPNNGLFNKISDWYNTKEKDYTLADYQGSFKQLETLYQKDKISFEKLYGVGVTPSMVSQNALYYQQDIEKKINAWFDDPENKKNAGDINKGREYLQSILQPYAMKATREALGLTTVEKQKKAELIKDFQAQVLGLPSMNKQTGNKQLPTFTKMQQAIDAGLKSGDKFIDGNTGLVRTMK